MLYSNKNVRVLLSYYIISYRTYYILFGYIKKYQLGFRQAGFYKEVIHHQASASLRQWPSLSSSLSLRTQTRALSKRLTAEPDLFNNHLVASGNRRFPLRSQPAYNPPKPSSFSLSCFLSGCWFLTSSLTAFLAIVPITLLS